jgi:hemerythrin
MLPAAADLGRRIPSRIGAVVRWVKARRSIAAGGSMGIMIWTEKLSVGVVSLDNEHKKLVEILNGLHDEMLRGNAGAAVMGTLLGKLAGYVQTHLAREEALFKVNAYPKATAHIREHDVFRKKLSELETAHKAGRAGISTETMKYLKEWLMAHILGTDMQYKEFFQSKGVK